MGGCGIFCGERWVASCRCVAAREGGIGKLALVKNDVPGGDDAAGGEVQAPVTLVLKGHAEENAADGARSEFVWHGGIEVGVT